MTRPDDYGGVDDHDVSGVYWWKSDFIIYDTQFLF